MQVEYNFSLNKFNSYHLKARCAKAVFPTVEEEFVSIYNEITDLPKIIIGQGNNIILSKEWYNACFVIFNGNFNKTAVDRNIIIAEAGATMLELSELALGYGLSGFEVFFDIPSSVGGAVVMNAGASGEEIKDLLIKVRYLDLADMIIKEAATSELEFSYRYSFFQRHSDKIVLKAWFKLASGEPLKIKDKMESLKRLRWEKQPRDYPNCGSVFKRPEGHFVGPMIDELGLKGFTIGGAQISTKHSGFIINIGNATGSDVLGLISEVQERIAKAYGIRLELEQLIV